VYNSVLLSNSQFGPTVWECPDFFTLAPDDASAGAQVDTQLWILRFSALPCKDAYYGGAYNPVRGTLVTDSQSAHLVDIPWH